MKECKLKWGQRLLVWAAKYAKDIDALYGQLPNEHPALKGMDDRFQDIAEPLVVLATLADRERQRGEKLLPMLIEGLRQAAGRRCLSSRERSIIAVVRLAESLSSDQGWIFLPSAMLLEKCKGIDELDWIDSPHKLAGFLKQFDLVPTQDATGSRRGYTIRREWVEAWKGRYEVSEESYSSSPASQPVETITENASITSNPPIAPGYTSDTSVIERFLGEACPTV